MLNEIDLDTLKENLDYNPLTGIFTWKVDKASTVRKGDVAKGFNKTGYQRIRINQTKYMLHRLAWLYVYGKLPDGYIDHINGNPSDNRIENLRDVAHIENAHNLPIFSNNTSGRIGVGFKKDIGKWRARICVNGKSVWLGNFSNFEDACAARDDAERKYGFHDNHGRESRRTEQPVV